VHVGIMVVFILTFRAARVLMLWMRLGGNKVGVLSTMSWLQAFSVENVYFALIWLITLAYPIGQVPAIVLTTVYMLTEMASNVYICSFPQWADSLVTMSPELLAWTTTASHWLSSIGQPLLIIKDWSTPLSCPAALAFWQLVGWWYACQFIFVADIIRRRAFLRTHAARMHLGRAHEAARLSWPFGWLHMMQTIVVITVALFLSASTIWSIALRAFVKDLDCDASWNGQPLPFMF
jgi:hypothetical protein